MRKGLMTVMGVALVVVGAACSRQGEARENYRDTTSLQGTPTDTNTMRDTSMMRDTSRMRDSLRDTTPATRRP